MAVVVVVFSGMSCLLDTAQCAAERTNSAAYTRAKTWISARDSRFALISAWHLYHEHQAGKVADAIALRLNNVASDQV